MAEKAEALNVESRTGAMNDVFESRDGELQQYAQAFHALPRQVGAVFIVDEGGGRRPGAPPLAGLELFDAAPTFARTLPKLIGTFALEALVRGGGIAVASPSADDETRQAAHASHLAAQLVADVARAVPDRFKALDEGEDLRITRPDLVGGGLVARGGWFISPRIGMRSVRRWAVGRFISLHAQARMQQRAVPREVVDCLLDHGRVHHDHHGAEILYFDKAGRERARRAGATGVIREMKRYFNTYAVVGADGVLVTVGRRYRKYRRDV